MLNGPTCNHGSKDHGDGHGILVWEVLEVVPFDGQGPPDQLEEDQGDEDSDETTVLDQDTLRPRRVRGDVCHGSDLGIVQLLTCIEEELIQGQ